PDGDMVTYQVFLDTVNPPLNSIANNLNTTTFQVQEMLQPETNYYWMVEASDTYGNTTKSIIDSFTTIEGTPPNPIVGKWYYDNIYGDPFTDCAKTGFLLFTNDLNIQIVEKNDYTGPCQEVRNENGTYELIANNQIEVTLDSGTEFWEIQEISETELVLYMDGGLLTFLKE
ncbi:MAG TPA: lipocalin family protein, partial [Xanthomarina sp.]|nr:lipocalin family protein [Xanthomarina sp.]